MFGPDTALVWDALQIAGLAIFAGVGIGWILHRRKKAKQYDRRVEAGPGKLEDRVRVLERIATDRSADLADEIEALRDSNIEHCTGNGSA